jgi:hypothetical protein
MPTAARARVVSGRQGGNTEGKESPSPPLLCKWFAGILHFTNCSFGRNAVEVTRVCITHFSLVSGRRWRIKKVARTWDGEFKPDCDRQLGRAKICTVCSQAAFSNKKIRFATCSLQLSHRAPGSHAVSCPVFSCVLHWNLAPGPSVLPLLFYFIGKNRVLADPWLKGFFEFGTLCL